MVWNLLEEVKRNLRGEQMIFGIFKNVNNY